MDYKATISADPILFAEDCTVLVIYEDLLQLAIRLKDTRWTYVDRRWKMLDDVVCFQDNFYLVNRRTLLSFHLTRRFYTKASVVATAKKPEDPCFKTYLVNSDEEKMLMVQRYIWDFEDGTRETMEFKVFELDYAKRKWIAMDTLCDEALFLGDNSSVCVLASKFPGCQANCVYYNHDTDRMNFDVGPYGPHDLGVYNVITGQDISKPYTNDVMAFVKNSRKPPIWIVPTLQLLKDCFAYSITGSFLYIVPILSDVPEGTTASFLGLSAFFLSYFVAVDIQLH